MPGQSVISDKPILLRMHPTVHGRLKAEALRQGRSVTAQINHVLLQECGRIARRQREKDEGEDI